MLGKINMQGRNITPPRTELRREQHHRNIEKAVDSLAKEGGDGIALGFLRIKKNRRTNPIMLNIP